MITTIKCKVKLTKEMNESLINHLIEKRIYILKYKKLILSVVELIH